jgi:hypothetical protein
MRRSLDGSGWKSPLRRRRWWSRSDGQTILRRSSARTDRPFPDALPPLLCPCPSSPLGLPRWRLQRKEPGWFVGEQRHVSLAGGALLVVVASGADLEEGVEAMCFLVCAGGRPFPCCVRPAGCLLYTQRRYCSTREDTAACDCFPVLGLIRVELPRGRWQVVPHN